MSFAWLKHNSEPEIQRSIFGSLGGFQAGLEYQTSKKPSAKPYGKWDCQ